MSSFAEKFATDLANCAAKREYYWLIGSATFSPRSPNPKKRRRVEEEEEVDNEHEEGKGVDAG
jgi:hypothetical protein